VIVERQSQQLDEERYKDWRSVNDPSSSHSTRHPPHHHLRRHQHQQHPLSHHSSGAAATGDNSSQPLGGHHQADVAAFSSLNAISEDIVESMC
jgi:hypothetical protein